MKAGEAAVFYQRQLPLAGKTVNTFNISPIKTNSESG
jgi:hypothetical protein